MRNGTAAFLKSEVSYVAGLVEAGIDGVAAAWNETSAHAPHPHLARAIGTPAVVGAAIGVLSSFLSKNRSRPRAAVAALVGTAVGLGVGVAWTSRSFTRAAARDAIRKVNEVRDAHWLERNPIAYA